MPRAGLFVTKYALTRLIGLAVLALFAAACQRNLIYIDTPTPGGGVSAPERNAVVESLTGSVETRAFDSGAWSPASVGQVLVQGSEVRTGAGARLVLRLTEGSKIYLGEETEFSFRLLYPFLDSRLTTLVLRQGIVWVTLTSGALDVEFPDVRVPARAATARSAYLSAEYRPAGDIVNITCLEGVCGFGSVLILERYKLADASRNADPEPMSFEDLGAWGVNVPELEIAYLATEAAVQGSATPPILPTATQTPTKSPTARPSPTPRPSATRTTPPDQPSPTPEPPSATPQPSNTPAPSPTLPVFQPTVTRPPFTPLPTAPVMGRHTVLPGETIFCIGRGYGVLPAAIAQANNLPATYNVRAGQVLNIPQVQWVNISAGPVCAPQFASLYPGLTVATATTAASATPAAPPLGISLDFFCVFNCGSDQGDYVLRFNITASGGLPPYTYNPAQSFEQTFPHCTNPGGQVFVFSADGQQASTSWFYDDPNCD
jgi:LysM repeat protein